MNQDLYALLEVNRSATNDEIRRAYRRLAKDLHPDQNKGNTKTEEQFKRVSAAFSVLGNPDKRKRYDAGEIDAMGNERANPFYSSQNSGYGAGGDGSQGNFNPGSGDFQTCSAISLDGEAAAAQMARFPCVAWITVIISKSVFLKP